MVYIHPSLKRLLIRRGVNVCFEVVYNIFDYIKKHMNKNKSLINL